MNLKVIETLHKLHQTVAKYTAQYYHTKSLATSKSKILVDGKAHTFDVIYGIKDILLIGAITESPILMTGGTDLGKTYLSKLMMNALFGKEDEGWHRLDFDLDFGKDAYTNVNSDFFHESGKSLDDLYSVHNWMKLPGFIADELNGAHPKIARKALHIIKEKDIALPNGQRVKIGAQTGRKDDTYQYQLATINEGKEYGGTFDMDKALRRRTTVEIPMDVFGPSPFDRLCLRRSMGPESPIYNQSPLSNDKNQLEDILMIKKNLDTDLPIHPLAEMFISYLEAFDFCKYSLTKCKSSLPIKNGSVHHICTQAIRVGESITEDAMACDFLRKFKFDMCPNIMGITPGISTNIMQVARGFAMMRAIKFAEMLSDYKKGYDSRPLSFSINYPDQFKESLMEYAEIHEDSEKLYKAAIQKYVTGLEVLQEDVMAAFPLVAYSKIGMAEPWLMKNFQGMRSSSISLFLEEMQKLFKEGLSKFQWEFIRKGEVPTDINDIESYCNNHNPWLWRVLEPYLLKPNPDECEALGLYS